MKIADCFKAAVAVAEQNCNQWIFLGNGEVFHADELREIAKEYDEKTTLAEEEFLAVTEDGSIGLLFPGCKEPDWYFVSPEFAVVNVLEENPEKYMIRTDKGVKVTGAAMGSATADGVSHNVVEVAPVFCKNCGAQLEHSSCFCGECGAKIAPEFCGNCGAKLNPGSKFCRNCGNKV